MVARVAIAVAIAVAFWMTGIVGLFTAAEKLEIVSLFAQPAAGGGWIVTITVRNTGTTPTSIDEIFINGVPRAQCAGAHFPNLPIPLNPGGQQNIQINLDANGQCGPTTFTAGGSIEVKLHTTGGKEYPKLTVLP